MKSKKTLITMAVASTLGWSAAAFAGSGHEVMTPYSPNEAGETSYSLEKIFGASSRNDARGSTSMHMSGASSGSHSDSAGVSASIDEQASLSTRESLALADEGIYSDFHVVTFQPMTLQSWDYYVLDTATSGALAASDQYWLLPTHELALIPSTSDEMIYDLVLVPTSLDDVTAEFGSGMTESFGE